MTETVQSNFTKEKHKAMINDLTSNSWPLISSGLLMLTENYISISISLPHCKWTISYLKPPLPLPPFFSLSWWLGSSTSALYFTEKIKATRRELLKLPPHVLTYQHLSPHALPSLLVSGCTAHPLSFYLCLRCQSSILLKHCSRNYPLFSLYHDFLFCIILFLST